MSRLVVPFVLLMSAGGSAGVSLGNAIWQDAGLILVALGFFLLGAIFTLWFVASSLRSRGLLVGGRLLSAWDIHWMNQKSSEAENVTHPCDDPDPARCMCGGSCACHREARTKTLHRP